MSEYVKVAVRGELPPGGKKLVEIDGRAIALFNVDGSYHAIRTGEALCLPAVEPVDVHAVEVRGDDIFVAVDD
jgi:3-phenylpropionate/trans-cinnamate dioxygenase ferredoxin subunit